MKLVFAVLLVVALSCKNGDESHKQPGAKYIHIEYSFWGEEEKEFVTGLFQFRRGNEKAIPGKLNGPATVALDGETINADSAGITGTFYEIHKPLESFAGEHTILFTAEDKEQYTQTFTFSPFQLNAEPGDTVSADQMVLSFTGLEDKDLVRVVVTDTSFSSNGINEIDTIKNGQLDLRAKFRGNIKSGPILLQVFKEEERILRHKSNVGGKISITYNLKREFELKD